MPKIITIGVPTLVILALAFVGINNYRSTSVASYNDEARASAYMTASQSRNQLKTISKDSSVDQDMVVIDAQLRAIDDNNKMVDDDMNDKPIAQE